MNKARASEPLLALLGRPRENEAQDRDRGEFGLRAASGYELLRARPAEWLFRNT